MGIASGTNSAVREIGGVFGVAVLATLFASRGDYTSAQTFVHHFRHAVWLGASFSAIGILAAAALPTRDRSPVVSADDAVGVGEPELVAG
jgi:hypothetical protein